MKNCCNGWSQSSWSYFGLKQRHTLLLQTSELVTPGANVIQLFYSWFTYFHTKLECLLDYTGKAYQWQLLQLNTIICNLRTKKFYNIGPWMYERFFHDNYTTVLWLSLSDTFTLFAICLCGWGSSEECLQTCV